MADEVTDELLDAELERRRQAAADLLAVEEPAADGHVVTYSYDGTIDGELLSEGRREGVRCELGRGQGPAIFEAALAGHVTGDTFRVDELLPDDYPEEALVGKQLVVDVTVDDVAIRQIPDLDDDFARDLDFEDLEALRASVRKELEEKAKKEARKENVQRVLQAILDKNDFEVPPALVRFGAALEGSRRLVLRYRPSETRVAEILAAVDDAGLAVADISTHEPDLEDLFLELTGGGA